MLSVCSRKIAQTPDASYLCLYLKSFVATSHDTSAAAYLRQKRINPQRLWKNYFKKRNTFENNENHPVKLSQDLSINL